MPDNSLLDTIEIPDIWQLVGERSWVGKYAAQRFTGPLPPNCRKCALVFIWSGDLPYVRLEVAAGNQVFHDDPRAARDLLQGYGVPADRIGRRFEQARGRRELEFLIGEVQIDQELTLTFRIDTDDREFLIASDEATEKNEPELALDFLIEVYPEKPSTAAAFPTGIQNDLWVRLVPARPMEPYEGFAALDLGNTNSTLVSLPLARDRPRTQDIEVINVEGGIHVGSLDSAVRISAFHPTEDGEPVVPWAEWSIGKQAQGGTDGCLVLGAKRLLADPDTQARYKTRQTRGRREAAIPNCLPAELLVCSMFKGFYKQQRKWIERLAVTCPTTYSHREKAALLDVVVRAWERSLAEEDYSHDLNLQARLIPLVLDEASAAAIYFLYRDFIQVAGSMRVLRYLYPRGVNLLLFDCGGGTTDVALVRAHSEASDNQTDRLFIDVLGRTGHRSFGGDDITAAVFRLLKARLASAIGSSTRSRTGRQSEASTPELKIPPNDPAALPAFLERNAALIDALVPTRFDPRRPDQEDQRIRMEATKELWDWAEQFKVELGKKSPCKREFLATDDSVLVRHLMACHPQARSEPWPKILAGIELKREEVDALIMEPLLQSIKNTNQMIANKLKDHPNDEVHCVYVAGNASLYPTVQAMLKQHLQVRFLEGESDRPGKWRLDEGNLKNAVAKGAVLALSLQAGMRLLDLEFDNQLCDRLPFDITNWMGGKGYIRKLFLEHEHYRALEAKEIAVPPPEAVQGQGRPSVAGVAPTNRHVVLGRQWPGDPEPSAYLIFEFEQPLDGPLCIEYKPDENPPHFVMRDEGPSKQEVQGRELSGAVYVSLVQGGTL